MSSVLRPDFKIFRVGRGTEEDVTSAGGGRGGGDVNGEAGGDENAGEEADVEGEFAPIVMFKLLLLILTEVESRTSVVMSLDGVDSKKELMGTGGGGTEGSGGINVVLEDIILLNQSI